MPDIHLKTRRLEYRFHIAGKYTVLKGDSAAGKTTLYELIAAIDSDRNVVMNAAYKKLKAVPDDFDSFRVVVEDKKSGFLFFQDMIGKERNLRITPAYGMDEKERKLEIAGASKICQSVEYEIKRGAKYLAVVYDAAAFALYMDSFLAVMRQYPVVQFYVIDWDSFEAYILGSQVYRREVRQEEAADLYESLEQYAEEKK